MRCFPPPASPARPGDSPPSRKNHKKLGIWVDKQRTYKKKKDTRLTDARRDQLDLVEGWKWEPGLRDDDAWSARLSELKAFHKVHKSCRVKDQKAKGDGIPCSKEKCGGVSHKALASWVKWQRYLHRRGEMLPVRAQQLEEIGSDWSWSV